MPPLVATSYMLETLGDILLGNLKPRKEVIITKEIGSTELAVFNEEKQKVS